MLAKLMIYAALAALIGVCLFPGTITRVLRKLGRALGDASRAGRELFGGGEVPGSPLARYEAAAGKAVEDRLLAEHPEAADRALQTRVAGVGGRLAAAAERREIPYAFRAVEGGEPVAYSVPGGLILVTRPLVALCGEDDHQLAGVLAHEVAHIDRRHAVRHLAAGAAARAGLQLLTLGRAGLLARAVGAVEKLTRHGYSREEELEADREGVRLAARAGFDPRAYPHLLQSVLAAGGEGRGYFRLHPPIAERLRALGR